MERERATKFIHELLETCDPRAIRLALMRHHYRAGFEWFDTDLEDGNALLHRLVAAARRWRGRKPNCFAPASQRSISGRAFKRDNNQRSISAIFSTGTASFAVSKS